MKVEKTEGTILPIVLTILAVASELLHIVNDPFHGILLICLIVLIWILYYLYHNLIIVKYRTNIFWDRDQSTPLMKKDIRKYKHLAFIGISQKTLHTYLQSAISENKDVPLPWETITVFFANDALGKMWENDSFEKNIRESKIKIARALFSETNHRLLTNFDLICFKQCKWPYSFGGCFCGNTKFDEDNFSLQVIHSVNSLPIDTQTQKSWTIRVEKRGDTDKPHLFKELEESFIKIRTNSEELGEIKFSLWERSFVEWNNFSTSYAGFTTEVNEMVAGLDLNHREILEVGAGIGNVSKYLIELFPDAKFTLMDDSANMLNAAKVALGDHANYELLSFPIKIDSFIKKHINTYDCMFFHLSIHSIVSNKKDLNHLASNCLSLLKSGGHVLIAVHNSQDIQLSHGNTDNWDDPFKHDIESAIIKKGLTKKVRNKDDLKESDITTAFRHGFNKVLKKNINIGFTMLDRKMLWEIPAILDLFVDVEKLGIKEGKRIVENAFLRNSMLPLPARSITVFQFMKI